MNILSQIKETGTFKALDTVQRDIVVSKTNRKAIQSGYAVAVTIGYHAWQKMSGFTERNQSIIKDMIAANHNLLVKESEQCIEFSPVSKANFQTT